MSEKIPTEAEILKLLELVKDRSYLLERCLSLITDKNDSLEMYRRNIALLDERILAKDKEIEILNFENLQMVASIKGLKETAKSEAIKEVYTRLSMNFGTYTDNDSVKLVDLFRIFDQIAKEMGVEL